MRHTDNPGRRSSDLVAHTEVTGNSERPDKCGVVMVCPRSSTRRVDRYNTGSETRVTEAKSNND